MAEEEEKINPQEEFLDCCKFQDEDYAIELIQKYPEIDPCQPDQFGTTPLHAIAANGLINVLEEVLNRKKGLNLNVQTPGGNTPLHFAAISRQSRIIAMLVKAGADPKIKNSQGHSPLFSAVEKFEDNEDEQAETVDLLVGKDEDLPPPEETEVEEEDK